MEKSNNKNNPNNTNVQQLFLETKNKKKKRVTGNRVFLGLRKLLQCGNSKQTTHSESKPPNPISIQKHRGKTKNGLDKGRYKEQLYGAICIAESISETTIRRCMKYGENEVQTMRCTVHGCEETHKPAKRSQRWRLKK